MARGHEEHGSLTPFQFTSVVAGTIIGVGVLILPRLLTEPAGHGAPLAMICGSVIGLCTVPLWIKIAGMFPGATPTEYASNLLGTIPGYAIHLFAQPFIAVAAAMVAREFGEVVITAILPETPLEVTTIIMLVLATVFVRYDLQVIGRVFEVFFPLMVFPVIVIAALSLKNARLVYLLPIWEGRLEPFLVGVALATASLEGMLIMPIIAPSINRPRQAIKAGLWAVGISGIVHTMIVSAALGVFNVNEMERLLWPTLELMKTTVVPGQVLERIEAAFLAIWVVAVFTTIGGTFYTVVIAATKMLRLQDHKTIVPLLAPFLYLIAMQPDSILALYSFVRFWVLLGLALMVGAPILLYVVGKVRGYEVKRP